MLKPYFESINKDFILFYEDAMKVMPNIHQKFNMVFADPPYFLSNDGLTLQNGKVASVNKGKWDKSLGYQFVHEFNKQWLALVREKMNDDATLWISGTIHNIYSIVQILIELDFKILNVITWQKTNPPPNFSCRYFTHSTEQIIWARKYHKISHYFNYHLMKKINGDKQMKDVWKLPAIAKWEKICGQHPTQKPLSLLTRMILASTRKNDLILDPFTGSSTTGIAANLANRSFIGIDNEEDYLLISKNRRMEIDHLDIVVKYKKKIQGFLYPEQYMEILD